MNADLEEQVKEMGSDYQAVVNRLRAARTVEPCTRGLGRRSRSTVEWLIAASLLLIACFSIYLSASKPSKLAELPKLSYGAHEYHLSVPEMIASQNADGSWQNDFLTRRNAEILSSCEGKAARIAYKKALRNLRSKGIF